MSAAGAVPAAAGAALAPQQVVVQFVCPALACALLLFLYASPLPAVLDVRRRRYIGDVNALPFAIMGANSLGWILYGFLTRDWFVLAPNMVGFLVGWWYTLTCFKFSKDAAQDALTAVILGTGGLFFAVAVADRAAGLGPAAAKTLWGAAATAVLALYYVSPLATMLRVLRDRDSSTLNGPLCAMNVACGALWFAYGMAVRDSFIALPNGVGAAVNLLCVGLCVVFPKRRSAAEALKDLPAAAAAAGPMLRLQSAHFGPAAPPGVALAIDIPPGVVAGGGGGGGGGGSGGGGGGTRPAARGEGSFFDFSRMAWRSKGSFVARGADAGAVRALAAAAAAAAGGGAPGSFRGGSFRRPREGSAPDLPEEGAGGDDGSAPNDVGGEAQGGDARRPARGGACEGAPEAPVPAAAGSAEASGSAGD